MFKLRTQATQWGLEHETSAIEKYCVESKNRHSDLIYTSSGLVLKPSYPYLGASPDGIVQCSCCGKGVLEVKCPYSCRCKAFKDAMNDANFFLSCSSDGQVVLKTNHAYYYQIQLQMALCEVNYCDFVIWSPSETLILRIEKNTDFVKTAIDKASVFYKVCVLPELLGKWYSKPPSISAPAATNDKNQDGKGCYCRDEEHGQMIACDNEKCTTGWYHTDCLKPKTIPEGSWFCSDCRK